MVPLRECMDGKLFDMSMGTFAVWLLIFSKLSEDDTRAFLAGDMTFYGATQKVVASDAGVCRHCTAKMPAALCWYVLATRCGQ